MKHLRVIDAEWIVRPEWTAVQGGGPNDIMATEDFCFRVTFEDKKSLDFWGPKGYIIDGASIRPRIAWIIPGIGTPTQGANVLGAFAHDPLFLTHALSFGQANQVALILWRKAGKTNVGSRIMWFAISSPFGLIAYRNSDKDLRELQKVRLMIRRRPDRAKFASLWFAPRTAY